MNNQVERWKSNSKSEPRISWLDRSELVAHLIRPTDVICDLGAGAQTLRRFLPASVGYIPVDCVDEQPGTWLADFNGEFTLPNRPFNVITCIGVVSHLNDEEAFFKRLVALCAGTFFIFTTSGSRKSVDYVRFISDYSVVVQVRDRYTCAGVLTDGGSENRTKRPLDEIICAHTPVLHYAAARVDLMSRKLIRGGNNGRNVGEPKPTTVPS